MVGMGGPKKCHVLYELPLMANFIFSDNNSFTFFIWLAPNLTKSNLLTKKMYFFVVCDENIGKISLISKKRFKMQFLDLEILGIDDDDDKQKLRKNTTEKKMLD